MTTRSSSVPASAGSAARSPARLSGRSLLAAAMAILMRPRLWPVAVAQVFVLARPGWWRRWPPIPAPDPAYLRFRLQTMYGDDGKEPEAVDVVTYLEWCSRARSALR